MNDLTLEEKMNGAEDRARERTAEKHFYDLNQPFFPLGFSVYWRNPGHWDINARACPGRDEAWEAANPKGQHSGFSKTERSFRIRGEPGNVQVYDERWNPNKPFPRDTMTFKSVLSAMVYIMEELMQEPENG